MITLHRCTASCVLALLLAACGGGDDDGNGGGDTQAPTASLTAPAHLAAGLGGTIMLKADASDDVGVAGVEFQVDGIALGGEVTSAPYQRTLDTATLAPGQHVLRVRARDAAGHRSAWSAATVSISGSQTIGQGFRKNEAWVGGLIDATAFAQAPDGRLFIAEQGGTLRIVKNGVRLATPFHRFTVDSNGERGLLGIALHPGFASNGWVYVYYTTPSGGAHNRISRLVASGDMSDGGETVLVDLPALSAATNHNGGGLHFGPDGKLYLGVGENASPSRAQDLSDPFGKLLRFNDDGSIPTDNPFYTTRSGLARAVWAYGLRNPYTFAFEPGGSRLYINDVGQSSWEEIDLGAAGANYGWPASEGPDNTGGGVTGPLFAYGHDDASPPGSGTGGFFTGLAIAGGAFYPAGGGSFPAAYRSSYFFADFLGHWIGRLDAGNDNAAYAFARLSGYPVDLLVGNDGALYALTRYAVTRIQAD